MKKSNIYTSLAVAGALALAYTPSSAKAGQEGVLTIGNGDKVVSLGGIESEWAQSFTLPQGQIQLYGVSEDLRKLVDLDGNGKLTGLEKELGWLVATTASSVGGIPDKIDFTVGGQSYNLMTINGLKALDDFDDGYFIGIKDDAGFSTKFKKDPELISKLGLDEIYNDVGGGGDGGGSGSGSGSGSGGSGSGGGASGGGSF